MGTRNRVLAASALFVFWAFSGALCDQIGQVWDIGPRLDPAEQAWQQAKVTGNLALVKAALQPVFTDPEMMVRLEGLRWISSHEADMTQEQRFELFEYFIELRPNDRDSASLKAVMARERFERWPLERRREAYWEAVRQGRLVVEEYFELDKKGAIARAALDGLLEFAPLIEENASLLDKKSSFDASIRYSQYLTWLLKLKGGADEGADRLELAGRRVGQLGAERVADLMEHDAAFHRVVQDAFREACREWTSAGCQQFARVALAQRDHRLAAIEREVATTAQPQGLNPAPDWLAELWELTSLARQKVAKNKDDADRGEMLMRGKDTLP